MAENTLPIDEMDASPAPAAENNDFRVNCTDSESLRSILDITLSHVADFTESCDMIDDRSQFISLFSDLFKNALKENIVVNGLPWTVEKSKELSTPEKEDHSHMVEDALYAKLSKTVSDVAHKRKFYPEQCQRILNIEMKHDIQNLKKAQVVSSPEVSSSSVVPTSTVSSLNKNKHHIEVFSEFCKDFNAIQEEVPTVLKHRKKIVSKLGVAASIQKQHRAHLK